MASSKLSKSLITSFNNNARPPGMSLSRIAQYPRIITFSFSQKKVSHISNGMVSSEALLYKDNEKDSDDCDSFCESMANSTNTKRVFVGGEVVGYLYRSS